MEALEQREMRDDDDASLLRFLVDMKGGDVSDKQLRDDLMTMLVSCSSCRSNIKAVLMLNFTFKASKQRNEHTEK